MEIALKHLIYAGFLLGMTTSIAMAEPVKLSDPQMDRVAAGQVVVSVPVLIANTVQVGVANAVGVGIGVLGGRGNAATIATTINSAVTAQRH
jgi:hypothetical protein